MSKYFYTIILIFALFSLACNNYEKKQEEEKKKILSTQYEIFNNEYNLYCTSYVSDNIEIAKNGAERFLRIVLDLQEQGFYVPDYDKLLRLLYITLYFIEDQKNNRNEAEHYFKLFIERVEADRKPLSEIEIQERKKRINSESREKIKKYAPWLK